VEGCGAGDGLGLSDGRPPASRKERIIAASVAAGFDDVGFASARRLEEDIVRLEEWIRDGRNGELNWMARNPARRGTQSEWVRTVIVFAKAFAPLRWESGERRHAAYADGHDYHSALRRMLDPVVGMIRSEGGRAIRFVDTGAVFERAWAREAGLGFIGRNTMLLSRRHGPNVNLAAVFTDLILEPDAAATGTCGECTRCLDACPTQALDDRGLDARRCISYLTIELKRPMTDAEREMAGEWEFGCDVCVDVCPYTVRGLEPIRPRGRGVTRRGK
jgi:epoxyqueuosine reductase